MTCKEIPNNNTNEKGGSKMALLAAPHSQAFCIEKADEKILCTTNNATLDALRKIRKAEASSSNTARLSQLDKRIKALRNSER